MKKINIKDLEINLDLIHLMNIEKEDNTIIIDVEGNLYINEEEKVKKPIIYKINNYKKLSSSLDVQNLTKNLFSEYRPSLVGTICKLKPVSNWQNIIELNKNSMLYFDHQSDGVEIFEDKQLEDFGWHSSALEINYRQISEFIEENCEGFLVFYDNEVQFNGFATVEDINKVRTKVKEFIISTTKENIQKGIIDLEDDDVIEALEFLGLNKE